ncbi:MAG: hypothetical protein Q9183_007696, partial [Haloplaca sp. 2 TL-2023]
MLLKYGAGVNIADQAGLTALLLAALQDTNGILNKLLQHGVNINYCHTGETALHLAVKAYKPANVTLLLKYGADVNIPDRSGKTALHLAALRLNNVILNKLLQHGAHVDDRCHAGETALHVAVRNCRSSNVAALLACGARVNIASHDGTTALTMAAQKINPKEITLLLLQHGADVDFKAPDGSTALHYAIAVKDRWAAGANSWDTAQENEAKANKAKILLEAGADVHARNAK